MAFFEYSLDFEYSLERLIGKKIVSIEIAGKEYLKFTIEGEDPLFFYAHGDCCSESWIEHMTGVEFIIGKTILGIEESDGPDIPDAVDENGNPYECLKVYKTTIKTDGGDCDIEYRNESNGYYGGSLDICKAPIGVTFKPVTGDF